MQRFRSFAPHREALFRCRPNRFVAHVQWDSQTLEVHCPNPGRLHEILIPGQKVFLEKSDNPNRKTSWTLAAAEYSKQIIPLVSRRASCLTGELILPDWYPDSTAVPEVSLGDSRIDWHIQGKETQTWLEVKACTLVEHGRAMFPDAPSLRASRHVRELTKLPARSRGQVVFVVMNPNAQIFSPNPHTDPMFCTALSQAIQLGVGVSAVTVKTDESGWSTVVNQAIPIDLSSVNIAKEDKGIIFEVRPIHSSTPSWAVELHRFPRNLTSGLRRITQRGNNVVFAIRGSLEILDNMEDPLKITGKIYEVNPKEDAEFLSRILKLRHKSVFQGLTAILPV